MHSSFLFVPVSSFSSTFVFFVFCSHSLLRKMEGNDDVVLFRKKAKRANNVRRKKQDDGEEAGEENEELEALEVSEKIMGAKFEQKMRKRVKVRPSSLFFLIIFFFFSLTLWTGASDC